MRGGGTRGDNRRVPSPARPSLAWPARLLLAFIVAFPAVANAQEDLAAAREAYERGSAAATEERWDDAFEAFDEAYRHSDAPSAGFNAAMALRAQGRHVEARDALAALVDRHGDWEHIGQVRERLVEEQGRVATLRIAALEPTTAALRVDGRSVTLDPEGRLALDPGPHVLRAEAPEHAPFEWSGALAAGAEQTLSIQLEPARGEDLAASPWLWIVVGAVVLAGAAVAIYFADDAMQLRPESANVVRFP